jgi:nucleotide-binding universal stress UspA family protein
MESVHLSFLCTKEWVKPQLARILVPLQGFPGEVHGIQFAFNLAEKSKANVSLLHCHERLRKSKLQMVKRLIQYAKRLAKSLKVPVDEERVKRVRASDAILKSSEESDCDLVIMCAADKPNHKFLLGSTARRVARKSNIPVIIVASWLEDFSKDEQTTLKKVLLPIRSTSKDQVALRLAAALKESSAGKDAELIALNLMPFPSIMESAPLGSPEIKVNREVFMDDISIFSEQTGLHLIPMHFAKQNVGEAAIEFAEKENVDLIVLGAHHKPGRFGGFLGSVSQEIASNSPTAVVITFVP